MALPFQFSNVSTLSTPQLDANYNALGILTPIPCVVAGTNALTFTPQASVPTVSAYANYMQFTGIAANRNTTAVTAAIGALAALPVYKDTVNGPAVLAGGEIITSCEIVLTYDAALNSGNGGFHLYSGAANLLAPNNVITEVPRFSSGLIVGSAVTSSLVTVLSTGASIAWPAIPPNTASVSQIFSSGASVGDCIFLATPASVPTGMIFFGWVSATSTVSLQAINTTASTITPVSGIYRAAVHRYAP